MNITRFVDGLACSMKPSCAARRLGPSLSSKVSISRPEKSISTTLYLSDNDLWRVYMGMTLGKNSCKRCYNVSSP